MFPCQLTHGGLGNLRKRFLLRDSALPRHQRIRLTHPYSGPCAKNKPFQQGITRQPVCTVDSGTSRFTRRKQA